METMDVVSSVTYVRVATAHSTIRLGHESMKAIKETLKNSFYFRIFASHPKNPSPRSNKSKDQLRYSYL